MPSDVDAPPPPTEHCDDCGTALAAGEWWVFEVESVTRALLLDQRVLCPECYDGAFTVYTDL